MGDRAVSGLKPQAKDIIPGYHPYRRIKDYQADFNPKIPDMEETEEQKTMRQQQMEQLAKLNDEQNRKLKRLLGASQGMRAFRGSAMGRGSPGNRSAGGGASLMPAYGGTAFSSGTGGTRSSRPRGGMSAAVAY